MKPVHWWASGFVTACVAMIVLHRFGREPSFNTFGDWIIVGIWVIQIHHYCNVRKIG